MLYRCPYCGNLSDAKRQIGVGSGIAYAATRGWSILAIPFYKKRCQYCKMPVHASADPNPFPNDGPIIILIVLVIFLLVCIAVVIGGATR